MADWEDENWEEEENKQETKKINFNEFDDESEVIPEEKKPKKENQNQNEKKEEISYEKKWQERNKQDIAMMKEIEESVKNIEDKELRLKKKQELMAMYRAEKFIGADTEQEKKEVIDLNFDLKTEKDYINLAKKSAAKINQTNKSNKNVFEFIKSSIECLLPSLNEDSIENIKNAVIFLRNNKDRKGDKKNKGKEEEKKVVPKSDRLEERKALYKQYGDGDISAKANNEDDFNDDGDFM